MHVRGKPGRIVPSLAVVLTTLGCSNEAPPRPQLLVIVDTDMPVQGQLAARPELSSDAAMDTLRVDGIATDGSNRVYDLRTFTAPGVEQWPLSFGIGPDEVSLHGPVRLRIRLFRGELATPGELEGVATLDPPLDVTIDRLVELSPPTDGIQRVRVVLRGDCLGVRNSFTALTTCIDADQPSGNARDAVEVVKSEDPPPTLAGSWTRAVERPCTGAVPDGSLCIPGGFSILGDLTFDGVSDGVITIDSTPLRPVWVSPFYMDRTEVTVGRLRALVNAGMFTGDLPIVKGGGILYSEFCTWLGAGDATNDGLPVNCVTYAASEALCADLGGTLASEAQWEHAARGRGQRRLYPWGNQEPDCCLVSAARIGPPEIPVQCTGSGIEPVGSHLASADCGGLGDESRDGILDLGGSVTEALRDDIRTYDAECWRKQGGGILVDPVCSVDVFDHSCRGGSWNSGLFTAASPFRYACSAQSFTTGVRCVYPGSEQ